MRRLSFLVLFFLSATPGLLGVDPPLEIVGRPAVIIVHPYHSWDREDAARESLNKLVATAKRRGFPTTYLLDSMEAVYLDDKAPTQSLQAPTGQFSNAVRSDHVLIAGGNWGFCLNNALASTLANSSNPRVRVTLLTDSSFLFMKKESVAEYLAAMTPKVRAAELESVGKSLASFLKGTYCITVHYDDEKWELKGNCAQHVDIYLSRSAEPGAIPAAPAEKSSEKKPDEKAH